MKASIFTLGCKVNSCESSALMCGLEQIGYEVTQKLEYADVYIINTCAVTQEAEKKSRQTIARAKKFNPNAKIIVTGCASEKSPKDFIDRDGVILVTGTKSKDKIIDMLLSDKQGIVIENNNEYYEEYLPAKNGFTRSYVKVQDGCNNFCSYCIIPYLRGRSRSRNSQSIIREIEYLSPLECVITGINLSAFNDDKNRGLVGLIDDLKDINCRIRLGSLEVNVITEQFLNKLKELKDFAPHFHLSLQSGSDFVLKSMNRKYTSEQFLNKCQLIREHFPMASLTTDVIVGYSTETDEYFNESLQTIKKANFQDIHPFIYSRREGTVGAKLKPLDDKTKNDRMAILKNLKVELKQTTFTNSIGKVKEFIPEYQKGEYTVGYTEDYIWVYVEGEISTKTKVVIQKELYDGMLATKEAK